jgi:hypothetical protein
MNKPTKVPVTERALFARVNRALTKKGEHLYKSHPGSALRDNVGIFYRIENDHIADANVNLEAFARELGVLADFEELELNS